MSERVIDAPLNESGIVGTAIGMGISGTRAVAEVQFEGFVYPAFDQIASHLGQGAVPVARQRDGSRGRSFSERGGYRRP